VACPSCGSTAFRQVAPNWVECSATRQRQILLGYRPIFERGRFPQVIGETPIYGVETVRCRVRHHHIVQAGSQGGPWPMCECGTFAIGLCGECENWVCGDDSIRRDARRLCLRCEGNNRLDAERQRAEEKHRFTEEHRLAAEERQRLVAERLSIKAAEMAEQIAQHGPCRAYPRHPASHADSAGNCRACVIGLR
jgi:hypothetical protein